MQYTSKSLLVIFICWSSFSYSKIVRFVPKFRLENLKSFVTKSNIYYFENSQGDLLMNQGFKSHVIIKGENRNTHYNAYLSKDESFLLIEKVERYLTNINIRKRNNIYLIKVGDKNPLYIGSGTNPSFHLNSSIISYFDPVDSHVHIKKRSTNQTFSSLIINHNHNPYFIPSIVAKDENTFYYTEIDSNGFQVLNSIDTKKNLKNITLRAKEKNMTYSLCQQDGKIFSKASYFEKKAKYPKTSRLYQLKKKFVEIYSTSDHLPGALICDKNSLFFISENQKPSDKHSIIQKVNMFSLINSKIKTLGTYHESGLLYEIGNNIFLSAGSDVYKVVK